MKVSYPLAAALAALASAIPLSSEATESDAQSNAVSSASSPAPSSSGEVTSDSSATSETSSSGSKKSSSGSAASYWAVGAKGQVKGINLGGWLLLEPWITPSLFPSEDIVDEYTFTEKNQDAESTLKKHWKSFINEGDIMKIKEVGFNMLRIPIGYWAFRRLDDDPYIEGAEEYLNKAIRWAKKADLKVIVDLHGAPGSQNGFDNSGQFTKNASWTRDGNREHTLDVLKIMGRKYGNNPTVAAINLLNEPFPLKLGYIEEAYPKVVEFHKKAYKLVRGASSQSTAVTISDAFTNAFKWNDEYEQEGSGANIIDHHDYQVFDDNLLVLDLDKHIEQVGLNIGASVANSTHPTIIGEWSGALTDCAKYLNGRTEGARYEGKFSAPTGAPLNYTCPEGENDFGKFMEDESLTNNVTRYIEEQVKVFGENSNGWFFWTWKTESAPAWDANFLTKKGLFAGMTGAEQSSSETSSKSPVKSEKATASGNSTSSESPAESGNSKVKFVR